MSTELIAAIREAQASWTGWKWTSGFRTEEDEFVYFDSRPADSVEGVAAKAAREYDDEVQADADRANELGDEAIRCVEASDLDAALECIEQAGSLERSYGDDPAWRPALNIAERLTEE